MADLSASSSELSAEDKSSETQQLLRSHEASIISELYKSVDPNFVLNSDTPDSIGTPFSFGDGGHFGSRRSAVGTVSSKLCVFFQGRLYERIDITAKCAISASSNATIQPLETLVQELVFLSTHLCKWHRHPSILQYHGLVFIKERNENIPYLLSERVEWNLQTVLEDQTIKLSQKRKVNIVHDIARGLNFLHTRKPTAIVHAALVPSSVLLNGKRGAKLANFFHAGKVNEKLTIKSSHHLPPSKHITCKEGTRLQTNLDMSSFGYIVKAIDIELKNREQHRKNILEDFYVLYDSENGPPEDLNASEVCRRIVAYLSNPHLTQSQRRDSVDEPEIQQEASIMKRVAHFIEDKFVSIFAPEGEDRDLAKEWDKTMFGER